jgi:phosphohistidine swiveling domain-containing protein
MKTSRQRCGFLAACFLTWFTFSALGQQAESGQSLGDVARKLRKDTTDEVKMTDADTKKLFESVDRIFAFAAEDTGMPKHAAVQRRLVSKADVEKYAAGQMAKEEFTKRFAQQELSMKKLGFLPRDFNLKEFLVKSTGQEIAAYYDDETKMVSMLNWVPPDRQEPILAHELTHALQDQNYDLAKWMKAGSNAAGGSAIGDSAIARKAVVEGQAMVVYVDYLLKPVGRSLEDTPQLVYQMEEPAVKAVIDSQLMHDAPMILRESGMFAYNQGLIFEGELLHKGGKKMAFAGAFARPPRNSHEVLQPEAYIQNERLAPVRIPDVQGVLGSLYDVYDSGGIGELDVRALLKQYGGRRIADDLSAAWQGGTFVAFRRKDVAAEVSPGTGDLALLYISRWKTPQAAERFARFYAGAVSQRYHSATAQEAQVCSGASCPVSMAQITTEEGPVIVEHWDDNSVIVTESFDTAMAAKLSMALRNDNGATHAGSLPQEEIGLRLFEIPAFQAFAEEIGKRMAERMSREAGR